MGWTYDRFGNRWSQAQTGVTTQQLQFTGGNNRINGDTYDAVGNLLYDGLHTYTYDDENRILTATLIGNRDLFYDAEGRRIRKTNGTTPEEYVYDKDGNQLGEMTSSMVFNRIELYAGNHHVVTYDNVNLSGPSARAIFIHDDWLGTERARSLYNGTPYQTCTNLPFGDQQTCPVVSGYSDPSPLHFTGKMRDTETNLDYFGARYLNSSQGRWMSPDWASKPTNVPYANFGDPQSLNLYGYVGNNPLSKNDADGHCVPYCGFISWLANAIGRDGGVKSFAKNVGIGAAKGAASAVVNTVRLAVASGNQGTLVTAIMAPQPKALKPSNTTQAETSLATQMVLPAVVGAAGGAAVGAEEAGAAAVMTGTRYVGAGEAAYIESNGTIPITDAAGAAKQFFYTPEDPMSSASAAQAAYNLPYTPSAVTTFDGTGISNSYGGNVDGGTGIELIGQPSQPIPATSLTPLHP
jgi:RHS repeat-associated protein